MFENWTLEEFRKEISEYIKNHGSSYEKLESFFFGYRLQLPEFPSGYFEANEPDLIGNVATAEKLVKVNQLRGNSWVFKNEHPDGKPLSETLAELYLAKDPNNIPAVQAYKISNDTFFTNDGNHRIYVAYLRDISVKIWFEDY